MMMIPRELSFIFFRHSTKTPFNDHECHIFHWHLFECDKIVFSEWQSQQREQKQEEIENKKEGFQEDGTLKIDFS